MDDCILCGDPLDLVELYDLDLHNPGGRPVCSDCMEVAIEDDLIRQLEDSA